jgi:hypothetical protein
VRSGKTSGLGKDAQFRSCGDKYAKNGRMLDQMKKYDFIAFIQ